MIDEIDRKILKQLQENARASFAEIGRQVNLTTPAVIERVR
ncbi:MAG: Lrp/AsnC family transcriptional regulator [Pyrinomonadaceae bacterium]